MDAYRVIMGKRDTRHYTGEAIGDDVMTRILQAGRMAGSSKNSQPVRMVVLRDSARRGSLLRGSMFLRAPASFRKGSREHRRKR